MSDETEKRDLKATRRTQPNGTWCRKRETLSKIAAHITATPLLYPTIFEANKDRLKDPNLIRIGQKLRIP